MQNEIISKQESDSGSELIAIHVNESCTEVDWNPYDIKINF